MNYEFFIANRYLRSKRRTGFISLITYISAGGIMIGVTALVIVMAVMNGFETEVRDRIIGADAHVRLTLFHDEPMKHADSLMYELGKYEVVTGISPYILEKGMLRKGKVVEGAIIKGIDEHTIKDVGDLAETIVAGQLRLMPDKYSTTPKPDVVDDKYLKRRLDSVFPRIAPFSDLPGIILGQQLSFRLGVTIGDTLIVISPAGMTSFMSAPKLLRVMVTGVFETGIYEYDDTFAYISISSAQSLFNYTEAVSGIELKLSNFNIAEDFKRKLELDLGYPYYPRTWHDMHRTLFRWMQIEKWVYTLLLSLIILIAAFNIVSSQIMMVLEKSREIGILKAMGAARQNIMRIFLYEGLIIGIIGTFLGLLFGWVLCLAQQKYKFFSLPGDVYFLDALPIRMQPFDFVIIAIVAVILTIAATLYPAKRAANLDPVDAIRYE